MKILPQVAADPREKDDFAVAHGVTADAICRRLYERFADRVRVKKPHVAVPNLVRILGSALELGNRRGFHSTSMRDLAEATGLSMGALYNYISDKEMLLRMILEAVTDAVDRVLVPLGPGEEADPRVRLRGLIRRHVLLTESMQPWFAFAFMEVNAFDREARGKALAQELRTERLLAEALADGIAAGHFRPDLDTTTTAGLIKPLLQDWYVKRWKHRSRGTTPEAYAEAVVRFVEGAIGA
jgi:TetR/AcrR family transcriptional regulator, cholesterol catabolism regulator